MVVALETPEMQMDKEYAIDDIITKEVMDAIYNFGDIFIIQLETVERPCCKECGHNEKSIQAFKQGKFNVHAVHTEASKTKKDLSVCISDGENGSVLYMEHDEKGEPYISERDNVMIRLTEKEAIKLVEHLNKTLYGDNWTLKTKKEA